MILTIGIDPAPAKPAVEWSADGKREIAARDLPARMETLAATGAPTLVGWDAPLSFETSRFSHRTIDALAGRWMRRQVKEGRLAKGAVSVLPFVGCPHWAITCEALGIPFRSSSRAHPAWKLVASPDEIDGACVIEVHPAVALAVRWVASGAADPMPVYKRDPEACARIAARLGIPSESATDDDTLDAYVAYELTVVFARGTARWVGNPASGGYVLPCGPVTDDLEAG
jgi:predicted nuclease with RNAse H fold